MIANVTKTVLSRVRQKWSKIVSTMKKRSSSYDLVIEFVS